MVKKNSCLTLLTKLDMFGYPVSIYYNDEEKVKKSLFGSIITIIIGMLSLSYVSILA